MDNNKLDKISDDVTDIKITLATIAVTQDRLTTSVEHHVKRTDTLEELVYLTREEMQKKDSFVKGAFWAISGLLGMALTLLALHK